jgi:hypothetical protein
VRVASETAGTGVPTSTTLVFNESIPKRAVINRPFSVKNVDGDGVVDLTSLRLCSKWVAERGPGTDGL